MEEIHTIKMKNFNRHAFLNKIVMDIKLIKAAETALFFKLSGTIVSSTLLSE